MSRGDDTEHEPETGEPEELADDGADEPEADESDELVDDGEDLEDGDDLVEVPSRGKLALVAVAVVAVVAIPFVWVLAAGGDSTDRAAYSSLLGEEVPAVVGDSLIDGTSFDIADHQGSWVVVNFFATWCPPCVQEHPELVSLHESYRDSGEVVVTSVVFEDNPDEVKAFFERQGGDWPVVKDEGGRISFDFGVSGVPETYIVDPFGVVRRKLIGGVTHAGIDSEIAAVAAELEDELTGEDPPADESAAAARGGVAR